MTHSKTAALILALSSVAAQAQPAWLDAPTVSMHLAWKRVNELPQVEVRDGVCTVYMADRDEESIRPMDGLLEQCEAKGATVVPNPPADAFVLRWYKVTTEAEIKERMGSMMRVQPGPVFGFYYRPGLEGPCHIVTNSLYAAAGHEILHCLRGNFHIEALGFMGTQRWVFGPTRQQKRAFGKGAQTASRPSL